MHRHTIRRGRRVLLALVALLLILAGSATAKNVGADEGQPKASTSTSPKATVKSLKKQLTKLTKRVRTLEQRDTRPNGPAGGDLAGNYPNPSIANDSIGSAELKVTHAVVSGGVAVAAGTTGTATAVCPAGELLTGGGHSWQSDASTRIVGSTPVELSDSRSWVVEGHSLAANTLYAWAICLPA